jgi:predicted metal-dependent hydrolase
MGIIFNSVRKVFSSSPHQVIYRKVKFNWGTTPIDWIPNEPFASHFINTMHLLLPAGEFWMCRVLNKALPHIVDEKLREDARAFIQQEAMHARAHGTAVDDYLKAYDLYPDGYMRKVDWLFSRLLHDKPFGYQLPKSVEHDWLVFRLGCMAALEHMTCILGQYVLDHRMWDERGADPVLLDLIRWHGAEEVEHRCVAFDAYNNLGGNQLMRVPTAVLVFSVVMGYWFMGTAEILNKHPAIKENNKHVSVGSVWFWGQWYRTQQQGLFPSLTWIASHFWRYFSSVYNPIHEGSTEQALAYLKTSSGYLATQSVLPQIESQSIS